VSILIALLVIFDFPFAALACLIFKEES